MEEQKFYRLVEEGTNGWHPPTEADYRLTKEQASERYNARIQEGISPDRLKIVRVS
tara:strand:+ start:87 stop:254 length:168 start_codon:yes stop_codon:yes gene_type:complete